MALILPNYFVTAFNVFLVRNYYANNVPDALIESAQIDGANELRIFWKIIIPLSVPSIATISLFTALCYWNDWVNGLYYITDSKYFGIQNLLIKIMNNVEFLKSGSSNLLGVGNIELPGTSVRMAMAVIGILPIVIIYPFIQKYFIKGVVVGAVKG
jgi:putative aldouronate transport system permease protein